MPHEDGDRERPSSHKPWEPGPPEAGGGQGCAVPDLGGTHAVISDAQVWCFIIAATGSRHHPVTLVGWLSARQ